MAEITTTILVEDADGRPDVDGYIASVRLVHAPNGGLALRAWPVAGNDGLVHVSEEDAGVIRDWFNKEFSA